MERVKLCEDGKYRWIYNMSTLKNPTMMTRMGKILGLTLLVVYSIVLLAVLTVEDVNPFLHAVEMLLPAFTIITTVYGVSYLLWMLLCGGTYVCAFEMDDAGILHAQAKNKTEKQKLIEQMTVMLGTVSPVLGVLGGGLIDAVNSSWKSSFFAVTSLRPSAVTTQSISMNRAAKISSMWTTGILTLCGRTSWPGAIRRR